MKQEIITKSAQTKLHDIELLFVHGAAAGAWTFSLYQDYFSKHGYHTHALSLQTHGKSEGLPIDEITLNDYVSDVIKAIRLMNRPLVVIGHSMGGAVVLKALEKKPHAFSHVICLSPPPFWGIDPKSPLGLFFGDMMTFMREMRQNPVYQGLNLEGLLRKTMFNDLIDLDALKVVRKKLVKESQLVRYSLLKPYLDDPKRLKKCVTLIGSYEDQLVSYKDVLAMGKVFMGQTILLDDAPHFMMLAPNWEKSAKEILKYLDKIMAL
ncbi:MAG: alpha/beta hydrolase [Acholeplasmataceae bacterium]